jgi:tRNA pseudouridine55 synthase
VLPPLGRAEIEQTLHCFTGTIFQVPPRYAAVRHAGQKLYTLARQGVEVEAEPRRVEVHAIEVECWDPPRLRLRITCASGTYIRALARDIGAALGVGAYLHALRRVASGSFTVADCRRLGDLRGLDDIRQSLQPIDWAVQEWSASVLTDGEAAAVLTGRPVPLHGKTEGNVRLYDVSGRLLALARTESGMAKPFRVFDGGR